MRDTLHDARRFRLVSKILSLSASFPDKGVHEECPP